jgi:hypothetical protein
MPVPCCRPANHGSHFLLTPAIREVIPGRMTNAADLDRLGLVAPPEEFARMSPALPSATGGRLWPSYAKALDGAPLNWEATGPDRSRADYCWVFSGCQWGNSVDATAARLMQESAKREEGLRHSHRQERRGPLLNGASGRP